MPEERKLVTVVFADVVGSTAFGSSLDPEVVRSAMGSYFTRMKGIAETYGGTVEKFIGDAVMVVFKQFPVYDALYGYCRARLAGTES
jgi:class 3 adenylate cyclase